MNTYEENRQQYITSLGKMKKKPSTVLVLIAIFAVVIIVCSVYNAMSMEKYSRKNARDYVTRLTEQAATTMEQDVKDRKIMLTSVADSIELLLNDNIKETSKDEYLENYLTSYQETSQFAYLIYQREKKDNMIIGQLPDDLQKKLDANPKSVYALDAVKKAIKQKQCVAYVEDGNIIFAKPIYRDRKLESVVCAGVSKDEFQRTLSMQIFGVESSYCVTNTEGKMLLTSQKDLFTQADELFHSGTDEMNKAKGQLESDIEKTQSGIIELTLDDGKVYYFSYVPIAGQNWIVMTIVPVDVLSSEYQIYMTRALVCAVGAAIVFLILVSLLARNYNRAKRSLEKLTFIDGLTGGRNNTDFQMHYAKIQRKGNPCDYSIVFLDVKDFKLINEARGFETGDETLKYVHDCIKSQLDEEKHEAVTRAEMDHFFVCLCEITREQIQKRIDDILFVINNGEGGKDFRERLEFHIEFTQGACIIEDWRVDIATLQERARLASKYQDHSSLNRCVLFTEDMEQKTYQDRNLDHLAEQSIANHEFEVYYQPKVSMSSNFVKGAEALVRWNHPEKGIIPPGQFIPILEESGRIQKLDRYVFEEVCRWLHEREANGRSMFPISINLSRSHFWQDNFLQKYVEIADKYNTNRNYIEFEITETVFMDDVKLQKVKEGIRQMHEYGFKCAVDDFGVGYSSISLINKMDVDILKFDRSFFTNLSNEKSQKIVRCLFNMAQQLNLEMVIEGIETQDQIDFLQKEACDIVQGYFYSKPLPEEEFNTWVDKFEAQV